jgi:hypothetical protein
MDTTNAYPKQRSSLTYDRRRHRRNVKETPFQTADGFSGKPNPRRAYKEAAGTAEKVSFFL